MGLLGLLGGSQVMASNLRECTGQRDCDSGFQCVVWDESGKGFCAKIYSEATVTPKPTTKYAQLGEVCGAGPSGVISCAKGLKCEYPRVNSPDSGATSGVSIGGRGVCVKEDDLTNCKTLWWFDNTTHNCGKKVFCGTYMYQGLQTFATEKECRAKLPMVNCAFKKCGDANCDGKIDLQDLVVWRTEMRGKSESGKTADFNNDGVVDAKDYDLLKGGFINGCRLPTPKISAIPTVTKYCTSDAECPKGQSCYRPPMPNCTEGTKCTQVAQQGYCRGSTITTTPTISCNLTTNPQKPCPSGYKCMTRSEVKGGEGVCIRTEITSKVTRAPTGAYGCNRNGDADGDGKVSLKDYGIWKYEYSTGKRIKGDFNCDRKVDLEDYQIWKKAFLAARNLTVSEEE